MTLDTLYNQDMLIGIRSIPTESIDCIVSDVPYLIGHKGSCEPTLGGILQGVVGGGNNQQVTKNMEIDKIYNIDCLEGMKHIPDGSIDAIK